MERYLTEDLGVPSDRTQLLVGSKEHTSPEDPIYPSRVHIIDTLLSLIKNPGIARGDNIIIYYSGHGSCYPFTDDGEDYEPEHIETLCPIDRDTTGANGEPVPDISDREFNTILSLISRAKGNTITVILDCCHSGSVTRGLPEWEVRWSPPTRRTTAKDMLLAGDKTLKHYSGYRSILGKNWCPDMDSHVLLAACMAYQFAKHKKVRTKDGTMGNIGIFTHSLVRALRSRCWMKETTYADLVRYLDRTPHQTPVVAGNRKGERIWYQQ